MVQWEDPALKARLGVISMNMIFLLLGLYGWEYFSTLDVEYAVIRGRLPFRWALIPYLLGRMFSFIFLLLLAIKTHPPTRGFNCLPVAIFTAITGNIGLVCASTNFMIRTWVIWKDSRLVHILLLLFMLGHLIVLALDVANLQPAELHGNCAVVVGHPAVNAAVFLYSLCYDFTILILSIVGLSRQSSKSPLIKRLRAQGLAYFVVAVVTYITPTVFSFMGIISMVTITGIFATTASTIASYRAVRSLLIPDSSQSSEYSPTDTNVALTSQFPIQSLPTMSC